MSRNPGAAASTLVASCCLALSAGWLPAQEIAGLPPTTPPPIAPAPASAESEGPDQTVEADAGALGVVDLGKALSQRTYPMLEDREKVVMQLALADLEAVKKSNSIANGWIIQTLFKTGRIEEGAAVAKACIKSIRRYGEYRIKGMERLKAKGEWKADAIDQPHINAFSLYSMIQVYARYRQHLDAETQEDFRWVFTTNTHYKGTTGNLALVTPYALYIAQKIWDPATFNPRSVYGASGERALKGFDQRATQTVMRGMPEFASRPYMMFNLGCLQSLDNDFFPADLRKRALMAYELAVTHCAGTWLRGNFITPAGRSYPPYLTQVPQGSTDILWFYFGGTTPNLTSGSNVITAVAEPWRPHPLIVNAATDRAKAYVHRSRFDGLKAFQTSFIDRTYGVYSTATIDRATLWPQTYPYGVMFDQPDRTKASVCWMTVPVCDDQPLTNHTQGVNSRFAEYLQHRGSLLLVADELHHSTLGPKIRPEVKDHKIFTGDGWYILAYVPAGYQAMINDSATTGRIFLHYGSTLISFASPRTFTWDPAAKVFAGSGTKHGLHPDDSEFRVLGEDAVLAMEAAPPDEFPGATPAESLAAFKAAITAKTTVTIGRVELPPPPPPDKPTKAPVVPVGPKQVAKGTYVDRFGHKLEKTFQGPASIDGTVVDYASWPLIDNPWMHQDWQKTEFRLTDGKTERIYDLSAWTVREQPVKP